MNITELAIYKKMFGGSGGNDNSIVGTWVFNDELTRVTIDLYPQFNFSANGVTYYSFYYGAISNCIEYGNDDTDDVVYDDGWQDEAYRTINILEEPTDAEFITWLRANAIKQTATTTPTAYTVSSIDELPTNAKDGSLAIVPSDSIVGLWEWKDTENPLDLSMLQLPSELYNRQLVIVYGLDYCLDEVFSYMSFGINPDGEFEISTNCFDLYIGDSFDDQYKRFKIFEDASSVVSTEQIFSIDQFNQFIKTNCNRLSGGYSLYTRENGEWVYKCEVV